MIFRIAVTALNVISSTVVTLVIGALLVIHVIRYVDYGWLIEA